MSLRAILLAIQILLFGVSVLFMPHAHAQTSSAASDEAVLARYHYQPHATQAGVGELTLELKDAVTQQPLDYSSRRLAAWLQKQPKALVENDIACSDKVRALASQGIGRRAAVDFNTYSLVTINSDRTVAFINPFLKLNNAKLEGVVQLPGDATAFVHWREAHELWIAMQASDAIAVIDIDTRQLKRTIQFAQGAQPYSLALTKQGVWVSFAGRTQWLRFDSSQSSEADARVDAPAAKAQLFTQATQAESKVLNVLNVLIGLHEGGIAWLEQQTNETVQIRQTQLPSAPLTASFSALTSRWLLGLRDGTLAWFDHNTGAIAQQLKLGASAAHIMMIDQGRYALLNHAKEGQASVIDVATAQLLQTVKVVPDAQSLATSASFAYVYSPMRAQASLLSLADLRKGSVKPVHIAVGAISDKSTDTGNSAYQIASINQALMSNTPDSMSMLIAGQYDGQLYQYAEGMMAPIGSFSNYKRSAQAMLLLNHGFEAQGAGRYRATVHYAQGGAHELVLSGVQPRFASCLKIALPDVPNARRELIATRPQASLISIATSTQGAGLAVQVKLEQKAQGAPVSAVKDLWLLAFDKHSGWQRRVPLHEQVQSPGVYLASLPVSPAERKQFDLLVSSATLDLPASMIGKYEGRSP